MDKTKKIGIVGIAIGIIVAIIGVSIIWATSTSNLYIKGSGIVRSTKWSVVFTDLSTVSLGNEAGLTSTAEETTTPQIAGNISLETYKVSFGTPGDYAYYTFKIRNNGDFPAKIDSGFVMPTPTCQPADGGSATTTDAANVCKNVTYTLTYTDGEKAAVAVGDTFAPGQSKTVQLKLMYNKNVPESELPSDDVEITNLNLTIPFIQY